MVTRGSGPHPGDGRDTCTATTAGADKPQGKIIERLLGEHPGVSVLATCKTPARMAGHDIVVMPSSSQYWHETFGIVSIEALLNVFSHPLPIPPASIVRQLEQLILAHRQQSRLACACP